MKKIILTASPDMQLESVSVDYPECGRCYWALLDQDSGLILGADADSCRPYHPCGGLSALEDMIEAGGFLEGSRLAGFRLRQAGPLTFVWGAEK